ncbi:Uncharacterised protein [Enterobacter hormaechei]|nr:Uncharacterised protein [Enterobacter hormaechei]VAK93327.1 Uncharacterised protein [Enterobacter hormaechei]
MLYTELFSVSATLRMRNKRVETLLVEMAKTVPSRTNDGVVFRVTTLFATPSITYFTNLPLLPMIDMVSPPPISEESTASTVILLPECDIILPPRRAPA